MSDLIPFEFEANHVRVIMDETNNPWFVATDVAKILGFRDAPNMVRLLDDDEAVTQLVSIRSKSGVEQRRQVSVINESGLYAVIMRSRKPSAKRFRKWVTSEVLPSIRKTGQYQVQPQPEIKDPAMRLIISLATEFDALKQAQQEQLEFNQSIIKRDRQRARDQAKLTHRLDAIETATNYFTIIGWWSLTYQESLPTETAAQYGRIAAKYCRKHNYEIGKTVDPRYGQVNTYPKAVLDTLFLD